MNRRDFIKKSSLTGVGGLALANLPLSASTFLGSKNPRVVLCVVAGISRENFALLFAAGSAVLKKGKLLDLQYNGYAAGHRLAFESILNGRYFSEKEAGKIALGKSQLFDPKRQNYLLTEDRSFLSMGEMDRDPYTSHFIFKKQPAYRHSPISYFDEVIMKSSSNIDTEKCDALINYYNQSEFSNKNLSFTMGGFTSAMCTNILKNYSVDNMAVHFMGADEAHAHPTLAKQNIIEIREGIHDIWECINMYERETLFIVMSDFGRNSFPNSLEDENGELGSDHNIADENVRKTSCMIASTHHLPITSHIKESTDVFHFIKQMKTSTVEFKI